MKYVVNYDFPSNLEQYCHRVGRTGRKSAAVSTPAQSTEPTAVEGYSFSLLTRNLAPLAQDLIGLLESCGQTIEPNLKSLCTEYREGKLVLDADELAAAVDDMET